MRIDHNDKMFNLLPRFGLNESKREHMLKELAKTEQAHLHKQKMNRFFKSLKLASLACFIAAVALIGFTGDSLFNRENERSGQSSIVIGDDESVQIPATLQAVYDEYVKTENERLLKGLAPLEVLDMYLYALSINDTETAYALLIKYVDFKVPVYDDYRKLVGNKEKEMIASINSVRAVYDVGEARSDTRRMFKIVSHNNSEIFITLRMDFVHNVWRVVYSPDTVEELLLMTKTQVINTVPTEDATPPDWNDTFEASLKHIESIVPELNDLFATKKKYILTDEFGPGRWVISYDYKNHVTSEMATFAASVELDGQSGELIKFSVNRPDIKTINRPEETLAIEQANRFLEQFIGKTEAKQFEKEKIVNGYSANQEYSNLHYSSTSHDDSFLDDNIVISVDGEGRVIGLYYYKYSLERYMERQRREENTR